VELELRRFSVTLKRLWGGVDFDLLPSTVHDPCLTLSTLEYCIFGISAGARLRWTLDITLLSTFVRLAMLAYSYVRVYYCSTCTLSIL
jgi:hypothetical protein